MENPKPAPLLEDLGGEEGIQRWMELFYQRIAAHDLLAPLFTADITVSRDKQVAFMTEFFGGPPRYSERYGKAFLRFKHRHVRIGRPERDAWMELLMATLMETGAEKPLAAEVERRVAVMADAMINHQPDKKDAYYFN